ncbi:MAG: LA2681 family HEPN domain-containing protein [Rhodospirillaceae bacterium]
MKKSLADALDPMRINQLSCKDALMTIAHVIDRAFNLQDSVATSQAFKALDAMEQRDLTSEQQVLVHYFRANAWENTALNKEKNYTWEWENVERQNQLLELRRAAHHKDFDKLDSIRKCQILTNLGNNLSAVGRFIEAIEVWDKALNINPEFAMAHGNRANGLLFYARSLFDPGHRSVLCLAAMDAFGSASGKLAFFENDPNDELRKRFSDLKDQTTAMFDEASTRRIYEKGYENPDWGSTEEEATYRKWTLRNRLFINPLNDLGENPISSSDVLTPPYITESNDDVYRVESGPPAIFGMYNQLKQEFISARHLYYEGIQSEGVHYSDKKVLLYNTLDYPSYSLAIEKIRFSYRLAYSIFDKIAYFLNYYLGVGHPEKNVNFRNIWFIKKGKNRKSLHNMFIERQNWPLRGLFWLSKDLFDDEFKRTTDPQASEMANIRNHLEHKFCFIHESWALGASNPNRGSLGGGIHLDRDSFTVKALIVLKRVRAAIIYLALAVHREEYLRHGSSRDQWSIPLEVDIWEDEWKN